MERFRQAQGPRQGREGRAPPVLDDRVRRDFTAPAPNRLWLIDISERATGQGKLYLCAVKDVYSGRIVAYSTDSRMKSRLAVAALDPAVARRGQAAGCIVHSDRGSQSRSRKYVSVLARHSMVGSMGRVGAAGDNAAMESFFALLQKTFWTAALANQERVANRHRDLDRTHLSPSTTPDPPGPIDARRVRNHHGPPTHNSTRC